MHIFLLLHANAVFAVSIIGKYTLTRGSFANYPIRTLIICERMKLYSVRVNSSLGSRGNCGKRVCPMLVEVSKKSAGRNERGRLGNRWSRVGSVYSREILNNRLHPWVHHNPSRSPRDRCFGAFLARSCARDEGNGRCL